MEDSCAETATKPAEPSPNRKISSPEPMEWRSQTETSIPDSKFKKKREASGWW